MLTLERGEGLDARLCRTPLGVYTQAIRSMQKPESEQHMVPQYTFAATTLQESDSLIQAYLASLSGINDDFWEEHVLESAVWRIEYEGGSVGVFGIHGGENLCFFHVRMEHLRHAQPVFSQVLERFTPRYAFVTTRDEQFLSLCMDKHTCIEKQAYFFTEGTLPVRPPEYGRELLVPATLADAADILDEHPEAYILQGKYYVLREDGVFLGQGFFNPNQLTPHSASIGLAVHPDHRQKNVGRSIMLHLKAMCHEQGLTPVCGCWYYNHNSKRTLESAGFVTQTRLLKVWFVEPANAT